MNDFSARLAQAAVDDPLWLEAIDGGEALAWVQAQNLRTAAAYCQGDDFDRVQASVMQELSSDSRIPWITQYGEYVYNFWRDQHNPGGLWRRTTLQAYREPEPVWETVLDIDMLRRQEGVDWVFGGATVLAPDYRHCLVLLSPGGSDACAVREFDLFDNCFVDDGFVLPVSKSHVSWIDRDHLFVADALDSGALTAAGYPRLIKCWQRGSDLASAPTLFEGAFEDVTVSAYRDHTPGYPRDFVLRSLDAFRREVFLLRADQLIRVDLPADAKFQVYQQWLLVMPTRDWTVGAQTYPAGYLLATPLEGYLAGLIDFSVLFVPTAQTSLQSFQRVGSAMLLSILDNVVSHIEVLRFEQGGWSRSVLDRPDPFCTLSVSALDATSDQYLLAVGGFLTPPSLYLGDLNAAGQPELLKQVRGRDGLARYRVSQHFARSADGTQVPYFEIRSADAPLNGQNRTVLYGYGGFQVSLLPTYLGTEIPAWLERGGVYVVANIRGGGEFGPSWHQAALRENRPRAYEDFAAVAEALISRKVTTSKNLGIRGGSNGGLLVGNMLTQYPQLFGCVVCEVPLLDMKRYPLLLAGASWIAEYGDPSSEAQWAYIRDFSPYHNVHSDKRYPPTLFLTSASDDRVSPAHARKMTYRMHQAGHSQVYFHESASGGHGGVGEHKQSAYKAALVSEFLYKHLG